MSDSYKKYNKIIVLVGLMGAGKSRIGYELAKFLDMDFIDADREIEISAGYSVADIFESFGEEEFRRGERKVMARLLSGEPKVIAAGGGAFINEQTRNLIKEKAISIWLKADIDTLFERTSLRSNRPLLQGGGAREKLNELIEKRYPIYEEADITVIVDSQTPQNMVKLIEKEL